MDRPTFIIDFDSTIVRLEVLEELAELALAGRPDRDRIVRRLREINKQGMDGQLPFSESLRQRLQLFGANRGHVVTLAGRLHDEITPSIDRHREWFRANAGRIYVISGGFESYIVPVVAALGIAADHVLANQFLFDANGAIIGYDETRLLCKDGGKVQQLTSLKLSRPIIIIGDGYTDYEMRAAGEADAFWAFCENVRRPSVVAHADRVLSSFDEVIEAS
jgi:D-3-phosphoglycerate dehydrogenase